MRIPMRRPSLLRCRDATVLEIRIVLHSHKNEAAVGEFDQMLENVGSVIVSFDGEPAREASDSFRQYGVGQAHPA